MKNNLCLLFSSLISISLTGCKDNVLKFDFEKHWTNSDESLHSFVEEETCDHGTFLRCSECGYTRYKDDHNPFGTNIENLTYCFPNGYLNTTSAIHKDIDYENFIKNYKNDMSGEVQGFYYIKPASLAYSSYPHFAPYFGDWTFLNNKDLYINSYLLLYDSSISGYYLSNQMDGYNPNIETHRNIELFCSFSNVKYQTGNITYFFGQINGLDYCDLFINGVAIGSIRFFDVYNEEKQPFLRSWLLNYISSNLIYLEK